MIDRTEIGGSCFASFFSLQAENKIAIKVRTIK
jgi:hypothetical protein